jgi:uncharacterized membrane protein
MFDVPVLLLRTVLLRPYVFVFLAVYLVAGSLHMGWRRAFLYVPLGYFLAWLSELSSIHWGFPYGSYYYIPPTMGKELWVFGVPFMDSLSYVFLSYCGYSMAIFILSPIAFSGCNAFVLETRRIRRSWKTLVLGSFLFVLLDIIIDPVALQGHRWFLGQIYGYRETGVYFGIPVSNFGGWLLVGVAMVAALQVLDRIASIEPREHASRFRLPGQALLGPALYVSVLAFNLYVTFSIGETLLGMVGCLALFYPFLLTVFITMYKNENLSARMVERHLRDFPTSNALRIAPVLPANAEIDDHGGDFTRPDAQ